MPQSEHLPAAARLKTRDDEVLRVKGKGRGKYHIDDMPPNKRAPPTAREGEGKWVDKLYLYPVWEFNLLKPGVTKLTQLELEGRYAPHLYQPLSLHKRDYPLVFCFLKHQIGISREQVEALMFHLFYGNRSAIHTYISTTIYILLL